MFSFEIWNHLNGEERFTIRVNKQLCCKLLHIRKYIYLFWMTCTIIALNPPKKTNIYNVVIQQHSQTSSKGFWGMVTQPQSSSELFPHTPEVLAFVQFAILHLQSLHFTMSFPKHLLFLNALTFFSYQTCLLALDFCEKQIQSRVMEMTLVSLPNERNACCDVSTCSYYF